MGLPAVLDAELVCDRELLEWNLARLIELAPGARVSTHTRLEAGVYEADAKLLAAFAAGLPPASRVPELTPEERRPHYSVINVRRIRDMEVLGGPLRYEHSCVLSFLWLGLSPGGLHCDYFNNILIQIAGRKRVTVFPAAFSDAISTEHYVSLPDTTRPTCERNLAAHPWLRHIPFVEVELEPGDALVIPSAAYHSARALSPDSVSLNTFLTPKSRVCSLSWRQPDRHRFVSRHARKEDRWPWLVTNGVIVLSRWTFRRFGRPLLTTGHYEVM